MNLPFLDKFLSPKETDGFFIALEIKQKSVAALLLSRSTGRLELVTAEEVPLLHHVSKITTENLVETADRAISKIEVATPPGTFIKKCIFTIPYEWQDGGKLKKVYLAQLKKLCDDLELTPIGFLVPIEAIMHEIRQQDGALSNTIFLELEDNMMTAYVARAGSIVEIERKSLEGGVAATAQELLGNVKSFEILPSRIIVLRGSQSENLQQDLVAHPWSKELSFLHPPQVSVMEKGFENNAILHGIAQQMKLGVAAGAAKMATEEIGSEATAEEFGFTKDGEELVSNDSHEPTQERRVISDNIIMKDPQIDARGEIQGEVSTDKEVTEEKVSLIDRIKALFSSTSGVPLGYKLAPIAALVILVGAIFMYYALLLRADVILYGDEQKSEDDIAVVLSSKDSTSDDTIKIKTSEIETDGSVSKDATGQETTGEKATGEVTVFNKTDKEVSFAKGDTISSDSGRKFVLMDNIEIASTSAFSTSYSNKKVKIQAKDFGSEYNIEKNSNFTFDNHGSQSFFAKNSDNFTGGSKKEVTVVSKEDVAKLEADLLSKLQKEAMKKAEDDISSKETLIPQVISSALTNKKFDKNAGDEAKKVTLSATGVFEIGYYEDNELANFIKGVSTEAPRGYELDTKKSSVDFEKIEVDKNGKITADAKVVTVNAPKVDEKELGNKLTRKTANKAQEIIEENDATSRFEIVYSRKIPFMPEILPWNPANIHVILETE